MHQNGVITQQVLELFKSYLFLYVSLPWSLLFGEMMKWFSDCSQVRQKPAIEPRKERRPETVSAGIIFTASTFEPLAIPS